METKAPAGYIRYEKPITLTIYKDEVGIEDNSWVYIDDEGIITVRNAEDVEVADLPVTGGRGNREIYMIGIILIAGGIFICLRKKDFQNL